MLVERYETWHPDMPEAADVMNSTSTAVGGAVIPKLGLGTWQLRGETCARIVAEALRLGYTHIDTAQGYANEEAVGEGLARFRRARANRSSSPPRCSRSKWARATCSARSTRACDKLRLDRIDLLLLHWPNPEIPLADSIRALNAVKRDGLRAPHRALQLHRGTARRGLAPDRPSRSPPSRSSTTPISTRRKCSPRSARRGMAIIAYCPIALGKVIGDPVIEAIAADAQPQCGAGDAALAGPAARRDRHPASTSKLRAPAGESRRFRLRAHRRRDGADERADPARITPRERAAMGSRMGLTNKGERDMTNWTRRTLLKTGAALGS